MVRFLFTVMCVFLFVAPLFAQPPGLPAGLKVGSDGLVYTLAGDGPVCGGTEFMQTGVWPTDANPTIADMPSIGRPLSCPDASESRRPVNIARRSDVSLLTASLVLAQPCTNGQCQLGATPPPGLLPPSDRHEWGFNPQVNSYGWVFKKDAVKGTAVAGADKVTGMVVNVWYSPNAGQLGIDVGNDYKTTDFLVVITEDAASKITINGQPANGNALAAFLYSTDKPKVVAYRDRMRYGAVLKADFKTK